MKKTEKDRITALYERLSHDDERAHCGNVHNWLWNPSFHFL